ncbi:MarR family transcriptional regulator [Paenibacillus phoenicis]|uniref:MarR family transcriptional regulator n=1 Tax=Paenibacillus phoenicis TaxID=554117 RepID=A0ABU5PNT5_9BACL|nr:MULTISPECIES: MarR family transcriptional regulator [Paenibacillus]EES74548.1 organic hydroperoxide resistance transcriptional regulator [Paenibacillus sp. oral taxon 786 str. D14]MCT2194353.1 MarR family transcriptional regulator [Paenibacillus sp. p3-SID1389]MEA3571570.1 MarR family transcriptional regulator [Paenibacillus phoenicis]
MNTDEMLKLENQLCFAFYTCSREIMKLYRPLLSELGLTYTQYITLLALWERDGITVKELGSMLYLDSGTLTPLLKKLEHMNLVTRTRDKSDERNVIIALTDEGKALKDKACTVPMRLFEGTHAEVEDVISMHRHINEFLRKIGGGSVQPEQSE